MKQKKCEACEESKPLRMFGRRGATKEDAAALGVKHKTLLPKDICLICEVKIERAELRKDSRDHQRKALEKEIRVEERKKAGKRARNEVRSSERRKTRAESARKELLERELSRRSLLAFTKRYSPNYLAGWMHVDVCNRLEKFVKQVERKENPRLMLFMPPRHGKSNIGSQHFPAWTLGHYPEWEFIAASYGSSLPIKFSRYVRGLLRDPTYQALFPDTKLDKENENVEGWSTTMRGGYIPAGVGGGITGKGANILVIDDPVKDAEEADSEVSRQSVWDWYGSTALTRLAPQSGVLMIQTRWHDDDLSGRAIQQMRENYKELEGMQREVQELLDQQLDSDKIDDIKYTMMLADAQRGLRMRLEEIDTWEIVSYPAIAEYDEYQAPNGRNYFIDPLSKTQVVPDSIFVPPNVLEEEPKIEDCKLLRKQGEALHPARYPLSQLRRRKNAMQARHWHALYQQNPVPDEGNFFKKEQFRFHPGPILIGHKPIAIAWDLAVGKKQTNDYTVGVVGTLDYNGDLQILDMIRGRTDVHQSAALILQTYKKYRRMTTGMCMVGIERGQLEMAVRPELNRLQKLHGIYPPYDTELKPLTDKLVRAGPLQGMMQGGSVVFADPTQNPWVEVIVHELLRFPNGTFDDCVDALAWLVRMIERNYSRPKTPSERSRKATARNAKILTVKQRLREAMRETDSGNDPMAA